MKCVIIPVLLLGFAGDLHAQHYLTGGIEFSALFFDVDELRSFRDTYNRVNFENLSSLMGKVSGAEGLRFNVGYRYHSKVPKAIMLGWQTYTRRTNAIFVNNEHRVLKLNIKSVYLEGEIGNAWERFFLNGLVGFAFKRKLELQATYKSETGEEVKRLDGAYQSESTFTGRLGIVAGYRHRLGFLTFKITYLAFATDRSDRLQDDRADKVADGTSVFPDDYISFINGTPYDGVPNKLDKLQISVGVAFGLEL